LSSLVLSILRETETIPFEDVADRLLSQIPGGPEPPDHRTLRRRVYDVLNVFCATGIVAKDNKILRYQPRGCVLAPLDPQNPVQQAKERLLVKEAVLAEKGRLMILYKLLIRENCQRKRPSTAVQLPSLFAGFRDVGNGEVKRSLDCSRLEVVATSPPKFFSPMNVLGELRFAIDSQIACLREMPEMEGLEPLLFPNHGKGQERAIKSGREEADGSVNTVSLYRGEMGGGWIQKLNFGGEKSGGEFGW
jgi:hypothetical protein